MTSSPPQAPLSLPPYVFLVIGVGACGRVIDSYDLAGWVLGLNALVGVCAVVMARSVRRPVLHRILAAAIVGSLLLAVFAGKALR